jgi:hypothetical protein
MRTAAKIFVIVIFSAALFSCRSAGWYLQKAIDKGASLDSLEKVVEKPVLVKGDCVIVYAAVDSAAILEECKSLTETFDNTFDEPEVKKEKLKNSTKKLQEKICPQFDLVYYLNVTAGDSTFQYPLHFSQSNGKFKLAESDLKFKYKKAETYVDLKAVKGYSLWQLITTGICCLALGICASLLIKR